MPKKYELKIVAEGDTAMELVASLRSMASEIKDEFFVAAACCDYSVFSQDSTPVTPIEDDNDERDEDDEEDKEPESEKVER